MLCVSDTTEQNHYLLPSGDHVKTSCSFLASSSAATHHQQSSLSLTSATFRMLSQLHTFLPTYPWQPSLMLFRYHTPRSHFPAPYPGSSPRRLQHHTPQCNPRYERLNKNGRVWIPNFQPSRAPISAPLAVRRCWRCEHWPPVVPGRHAYHLRLLRNSTYLFLAWIGVIYLNMQKFSNSWHLLELL